MYSRMQMLECNLRISALWRCENKGTDQLCNNCLSHGNVCFSYIDGKIAHLLKSDISSPLPYSVAAHLGLSKIVENLKERFSHDMTNDDLYHDQYTSLDSFIYHR